MSDLNDIIRILRDENCDCDLDHDPSCASNNAANMLAAIDAATRFRSDGCARDVRRILHPEPVKATEPKERPVCTDGFHWLGQDFAHCEECGRDISLHEGLAWGRKSDPFSKDEPRIIPFDEARRGIPMFAYYVTPIGAPEDYAGPFRYDKSEGWVTE